MIRLRVGDLIKNNFSEFDLARLHGLGSEHFKVSEAARARNAAEQEQIRREARAIADRMRENTFEVNDQFYIVESIAMAGNRPPQPTAGGPLLFTIPAGGDVPSGRSAPRGGTPAEQRARRANPQIPAGTKVIVSSANHETKVYGLRLSPALPKPSGGRITDVEVNFLHSGRSTIRLDHNFINATATERVRRDGAAVDNSAEDAQTAEDVSAFFSPEGADGNAVFKAFQSTKGEGLAGVITRIGFNWQNTVWETEGLNNRAPKFFKVSVDFKPVNDLNPGLDSNGNMIAPPYNIGDIMRNLKISRAATSNADRDAAHATTQAQASTGQVDQQADRDEQGNTRGDS
jgi:hypothetical protein